jgi:DNA-binding CsgD family transcriptional regulator
VAESEELRGELTRVFVESHDYTLGRKVGARAPRSVRRAAELSPREAEIHQLIAQGLTNPEISRLLFISPSTTKVHVRHILEKLGVRSRVEAARVWEPEPPS